ncbi:Zinc finger C2H2 [Penicillium paradoxum]|uniref:Zinc finger C2H2 n=1 Tax=Penicillium paradoxum TaxID=176176 RepID=UPI00254811B8|nr:Zinc finger C2H2 [Penicillium paradoxum]KAJ5780675.1 Zinc finger C2H2 [Penicillium paradoxum]
MSTAQPEPSRVHPRRRPVLNTALPTLSNDSLDSKMRLQKGETFHTPTSPPSTDRDPVLNVRSLPHRSVTSLEALAAAEERMTSILGRLTLDSTEDQTAQATSDDSILKGLMRSSPNSMSDSPRSSNEEGRSIPIPVDEKKARQQHSHESDSGLGTSISSEEGLVDLQDKVNNDIHDNQSAITSSIAAFDTGSSPKRQLGSVACKQIERFVLVPILKEPRLKPFHSLVRSVPQRIVNKQIVCLRDLEKTLLWLAPVSQYTLLYIGSLEFWLSLFFGSFFKFKNSATSRNSYLNFCEFTIQCLHTSTSHLNDRDQRLPADRPYTNGYFLDLVSQVRRYAAMVRAERQRVQATQDSKSDKSNIRLETATLEGGLSKNGKPAELVVMQDGKPISLATGKPYEADVAGATKRTITLDDAVDEGVERSMARRKKDAPPMNINQKCSDCDKVFKRPCDLTKHEKTHTRPWKCEHTDCNYHTKGWPTEKERDRHMNDRHSDKPTLFKCQFHKCPYASKRASNCKQHMEKSHGWVYVRSKNNGRNGSKRGGSVQTTPQTPSVSTPASKATDFASPIPGPSPSPSIQNYNWPENPQFNFADPPAPAHGEDFPLFGEASPYLMTDINSFPTSMNLTSFQSQFEAGDPNGLIPALEMHRQSMNSMSIPSADSVPDLMGPVSFDGSPLTGTESINFDLDWSNLEYPNEDYTAMAAQIPQAQSFEAMKGYSNDYDQMNLNHCSFDLSSKHAGLSPGAQGNAMLYSPDSCNVGDTLSERYEYGLQAQADNDFTLYNQSAAMSHGAQPMMQTSSDHSARYSQPPQHMFPSLEQERVLQSMQPWNSQQPQGHYLPRDMDLEFMK